LVARANGADASGTLSERELPMSAETKSTESKPPEVAPLEERLEQRRRRRLTAFDAMTAHRQAILSRRGGEPVDVDGVLDELRGCLRPGYPIGIVAFG
jgi:hypothetical protein